jgi:alkylhydroperoxidase family enzyme
MAHVNPVRHDQGRWWVLLTLWFTRAASLALTSLSGEAMIEPVQGYARTPAGLRGYAKLARATAGPTAPPDLVTALAELCTATLTASEYCLDSDFQVTRRRGPTDPQLLALPAHHRSDRLSDADKNIVLEHATVMSRTPVEVSDASFAPLRENVDHTQLLPLTHVALQSLRGRSNLALGIGVGVGAGALSAVPASPTTRQDQL